ncbi:hypothetical protein BDV59DRAFT_211480 [Aspergillus ambiguus]|uniref:uncharacterized protein n=1 Tax=Aspergillus ambiguus TaxID=176160 RepID=UPI003CCCFDF0
MLQSLLSVTLAMLAKVAASQPSPSNALDTVTVHWLGSLPEYHGGTTFGLPWPQGRYYPNETIFNVTGSNQEIPLQSWVTGYWRDGSIKWTAHAIPALDTIDKEYNVSTWRSSRGILSNSAHAEGLTVRHEKESVTVDTGKIIVSFPRKGNNIVDAIRTSSGKTVGTEGKLVLHTQSALADDVASRSSTPVKYSNFQSTIDHVSSTKETSVRALITINGTHQIGSGGTHDRWLPFTLRFYLYANSSAIRVVHSLTFDGNPDEDFVTAIGLQFQVPFDKEPLYDRHVRIPGVGDGYLHEAIQGVTGLRRDPGASVRLAQFEGKKTPNISTWDERVSSRMQWIPAWNDYKMSQLSPDGFTIKKRTRPGQGWVTIPGGTRSEGLMYLGGATCGGLAIGLRDFWKKFPTGFDISGAGSERGQITLWLYSPEAAPLDLRPFHDKMGEHTYEEQLDALEITYEDYEPGFNTPYGISRSSEIFIHAFDETPSADDLGLLSRNLNDPPVLTPDPSYIRDTKAIGSYWGLPDMSSEKAATIESHLDFLVSFYQDQVDYRRWYGFLDYGDIMHTYDEDRHVWRYDVGGYAWDNSELSPDLFFWQYFLRTGRSDVYRFAEALTRHTSEVDVYHIGDWKGLGTRHGVQHYGDSAKQVRISQPQYRKYFYYLTGGDERVGELLEETLDADKTYGILDPQRKVRDDGWTPHPGQPAAISLGTDWAGLAAGWLIEWERRGPRWKEARMKLTRTAQGIAALRNGFVTGEGLYAITNGSLLPPPTDPENRGIVSISHLDAVFGLPEVMSELLEYLGDDTPEGLEDEQHARYGEAFTAYDASQRNNITVAERAWNEFYNTADGSDGLAADAPWTVGSINGSAVLIPVDEATWISTNAAAQYGLAAIQNLALVGNVLKNTAYTYGQD